MWPCDDLQAALARARVHTCREWIGTGPLTLNRREIFEGLCSVGVTVSEEEVGRMVKAADKDGDGISLMELQAMINDVADGKAAMKAALKQVI